MRLIGSEHTLVISEEERQALQREAGKLNPQDYPALVNLYRTLDLPESEE